MKYKASFALWPDHDAKTGKVTKKEITIETEGASPFLQEMQRHHSGPRTYYTFNPLSIQSARLCSIDGIACKHTIFVNAINKEIEIANLRRFKDAPPLKHFNFTAVDIERFGLRQVGKEIFVRKPPNEDKFFEKMEQVNESKMLTLYHGTNATNIHSILFNGLLASSGGAFGRGLYVGPMEKAKAYNGKDGIRSGGWNKKKNFYATIFELDVITGKMIKADKLDKVNWRLNYDTVYYDGFANAEYCLKNPHQALIKKIILL